MQNFHLFKVSFISHSNTKPSRIKLRSERFGTWVYITTTNKNLNTIDTCIEYLKKNGFNIIGVCEGNSKCMYIISDTFKTF
jgi:hypothetical protein